MARVLIAGCGYVGAALGHALIAAGDRVWGLRRDVSGLPRDILPIAADLSDPSTLRSLPAPLDAVVYAAAPRASDEIAYANVYVRGLGNLLERIEATRREHDASPPRVVLLSSTSAYGQTAGEWVDESSPTTPADFRGRLVLRSEEMLRSSGLPGVALRLGGIYGPGRTALIEAVRAGRAQLSSGPPRFTNRIHRDDVVGAVRHLLALPAPEPIYVGVDEEPADRNEVLRFLAERLGTRLGALDESARTAGRANLDRARGAARPRQPLSRETNKRCSSARLRRSGYRFRHPTYREGYDSILREEKHAPSR